MQNKEKSSATLRRILSYTRPYKGRFIAAFIFSVISVALQLAVPILIGNAIDYVIGADNVDFVKLLNYCLALIPTVAGAVFFQYLMHLCACSLAYNTVKDMRAHAFDRITAMPLSYLDTHPHGDVIARTGGDIDLISDGLLQGMTQLFNGITTITLTLIFMFTLNWLIATVVVVLTPLSLFVASFIAKGNSKHFKAQSERRGAMSGDIEELLGGLGVVKAFGREAKSQEGFEKINDKLYYSGVRAQFYSALINPCTRFVNAVVYACVGVVGGVIAVVIPTLGMYSGVMTSGRLSSFFLYANQYTRPFNEITGVVNELQNALSAARRVFALIDEPIEKDDSDGITQLRAKGDVSIEGVDFAYDSSRPLITDFNLQVQSGQRIAIVGPTGCGKTTFINLLMRFYDVDKGSILIDNIDIRDMTRKALRSNYGMILQDTWLFNGTIRDNIAYGKPDASQEEIIQAAKLASCHEFISKFKDGYDTIVDSDSLSQGQRQLLCIARIMLTRPPMLILDEATSSIDTRTEMKIQQAFAVMMEGRTSFIVAHRLSTIKGADKILVMKDGNIIEQGSHAQLLADKGFYYTLYNSQFAKEN
ncbi:MAG: ABC transporter ATP-binding protein/permease [Clostridia bacterium]|nr:ABC transporter ATP-binding protein/permease [Clostridia bacterium]